MKKVIKFIGTSLLLLLLIAILGYLYIGGFGEVNFLEHKPRPPGIEIPITYNIGWWGFQNKLNIDSFKVDIIDSKLDLFSYRSLISYKISGHIAEDENSQSYIGSVHMSEQFNRDTSLHCDRIIEITPIVITKDDKRSQGEKPFSFKNEYIITSTHRGVNRIKFICGPYQQTIELFQRK